MNRRNFFRGLFALPIAAIAAPLAALAPKPFADGGIIPQDKPYIVGEHRFPCFGVDDASPRTGKMGELVIHLRCDTTEFEADLEAAERRLKRIIAMKRLI
jgi:hypothetical protein